MCDLSDHSDFDDEVDSLQGLSANMIVEACVRCLEIIDPEFQSPKTLPEAMSARYRMCSTLANAIQVCKSCDRFISMLYRSQEKHSLDKS